MSFLLNLFSEPELILRLIVALLLGSLVGLERTIAQKHAGLRTFALVSLGACVFVVLGQLILAKSPDALGRVLANVLVGIGFLGGGIIFTQRDTVRGLTTAAALWTSAGIGATVALGYYVLAIWISLLVLSLLYLVGRWEANLRERIEAKE